MDLRIGAYAALLAISCSDRPVPEIGAGDGQSGDPCVIDGDCIAGSVCFEEVCVQQGTFRVSLSWNTVTDLDLHVLTPNGIEIAYSNPMAGGGVLDLDDCVGGACATSGPHVENIVFNDSAVSGTYRVWVQNYDGRAQANYTLQVAGAVEATWSGSLPSVMLVDSQTYTFEYGT